MAAAAKTRSGGVCVVLLVCVFTSCQSWVHRAETYKRQISVQLNPNSTSPPPGGDLLHVRAVGDNDTLHFLFCSQGAPTLLLVHTNSSSSTVTVNWPEFLARNNSGSLTVEPQSSILYSTAIVFSRLLEYNDVNDTAEATSKFFPPYELQDFIWSHLRLSGPVALLCGANSTFSNGSLCLKLSVFDSEGRAQTWPQLLHSANSSQVEVWLDGIVPRANNSRFLLELQAVGGAYPFSRVDVRRSIDDEYTPTIFKVSQWVSSANGSSDILGFVQWKPVAYLQSLPALENSTSCRYSDPVLQSGEAIASSSALIQGFYSEPEAMGLNVSFGLAGDPFYNNTMFLSWAVLVGIGSPPVDSFSPLVITIMAVGLGTPMVLLLLGGVCVCLHKKRNSSTSTYEPIN
ncbi:glycosylated lysosomal membrane protein [Melanotaenia boesemani]|uniref:glycosylated lysosomal membrane protein n=1 Tax=Melanotaenia boesemani TaxID=1250792 RepID=UPI001C0472B5|nr:glycosylated lysosomal membrane protein [Melanotaenia boesemani]